LISLIIFKSFSLNVSSKSGLNKGTEQNKLQRKESGIIITLPRNTSRNSNKKTKRNRRKKPSMKKKVKSKGKVSAKKY
jgi:hypothetical protein